MIMKIIFYGYHEASRELLHWDEVDYLDGCTILYDARCLLELLQSMM